MHAVRGWRPAILHNRLCGSQHPKSIPLTAQGPGSHEKKSESKIENKSYNRDHYINLGYQYKVLELK